MSPMARKLVITLGLLTFGACSNANAPEPQDQLQARFTTTDTTAAGTTAERGPNLMGSGH